MKFMRFFKCVFFGESWKILEVKKWKLIVLISRGEDFPTNIHVDSFLMEGTCCYNKMLNVHPSLFELNIKTQRHEVVWVILGVAQSYPVGSKALILPNRPCLGGKKDFSTTLVVGCVY